MSKLKIEDPDHLEGAVRDRGGAVFNARAYGLIGDGRRSTGGAMTGGSAVLTTTAGASFGAADVGKHVLVPGAGTSGADLYTTISVYTSATQVTLATAAGTTVSGKVVSWGTDDTAELSALMDAAPDGSQIYFPNGIYSISSQITKTDRRLTFVGESWDAVIRRTGSAVKVLQFNGGSNIELRNIGFDANGITSYGGICFYSVKGVRVQDCHAFDSNKADVATGSGTDRYAFLFGVGGSPSENVWITDNLIENLQLEVDYGKNVHIQRNISIGSVLTGAIGVFTINDNLTLEDYVIEDNIIINPSAGRGIVVGLDPASTSGCIFRRIKIRNNTLLLTNAGTNGILVGTGNNGVATTGNIFEDIEIEDNRIVVPASRTAADEQIFANSSATAAFVFKRLSVRRNKIFGNAVAAAGVRTAYTVDSVIAENECWSVSQGVSAGVCETTQIVHNRGSASLNGVVYSGGAARKNRIEGNDFGTPTNQFSISGGVGATDHVLGKVLTGSAAFDPANLGTGNTVTLGDVTITGAQLGDRCAASFSASLQGCFLIAECVGADTVRVSLVNVTGLSKDVAAGTAYVTAQTVR